jgi:cell pole-organizing protein PopZ
MTMLDATSEPSMEDILASIRKIIAEDPPGLRATPAPAANLGRPSQPADTRARAPEPASLHRLARETFSSRIQPVAAQ